MAKMLKQLVFGQKKNPPAPPRPDYEGDKSIILPYDNRTDGVFFEHDYENIPKFKCRGGSQVKFIEKKESELLVFDNYSEPADLRAEISTLESDPLYMSPVDDRGTAPPLPLPAEEDMYCLPYDKEDPAPPLPHPCLPQGRSVPEDEAVAEDATYDLVPDESQDDAGGCAPAAEYDEPWEWSVGARLTSSLQVSPAPSSLEDEPQHSLISDLDLEGEEDEEKMTSARQHQRRLLLYETAFDSRVKPVAADECPLAEGLMIRDLQGGSPLFRGAPVEVARAASRSSFGSTSGSSASSTPTHQPMEVAARGSHSPIARHPFTPTERRKVTLVRDHQHPRSMSPQARPSAALRGSVVNQNFERKISFIGVSGTTQQWDNVSRCSGSDRSSSQESMELSSSSVGRNNLGRSASRDSLVVSERRSLGTSNYPNNWKELSSAKLLEKSNQKDPEKKTAGSHPGVKVLPTDNSPRPFSKTKSSKSSCDLAATSRRDPELKENADSTVSENPRQTQQRQSPENDGRSSEDYDPPWDLLRDVKRSNVLRPSGGVNGSVSVPEKLSSGSGPSLPTSVTHHDRLDEEALDGGPKAANKPTRPNGVPSSRPSLNLNLSSDSPRKGRQSLTLNFGCAALGAVGEKVDPQLTLEKQGWYHGSISRVDAEGKLRVLKEGSYLVRNSESSKQDYSLSLKSARGFMHMKIVPTSEGRFILGQFSNPFSSIPEMIQHYSVNKLPIKGAEHMSLLYPVMDQLL